MKGNVILKYAVVCAAMALVAAASVWAQTSPIVKVSDAIEGGAGSVSSARCGSNVVVGFGDVESGKPNSWAGFAYSKNGGTTFKDGGTLPVASSDDSLGFQPFDVVRQQPASVNFAVACSNPSTFYYAAPGSVGNVPNTELPTTSISVSTSNDGGASWSLPVSVGGNTADIITVFSPTIAVDPSNPKHLYVAYLYADLTHNFFNDCSNTSYQLNVVESTDGGNTWFSASPVDHACDQLGEFPALTGTLADPNMVVGPEGIAYLTVELIGQNGNPNKIHFFRSTDQGNSFSAPMIVSTDAVSNAMPKLAVDRTTSKFRGTVYLTWSGKPRGTTTEVLMSDSLNQGASFSFPRSVRSTSLGTQIDPVVAVDNDGQVADCYYVTVTNTPTSSSKYFYTCATSFNHAATWTNVKLVTSAPPGFNAITSDFLLHNDGFFTEFEVQNNSGQRQVVGQKSDNP